jgi:hypothetical protein
MLTKGGRAVSAHQIFVAFANQKLPMKTTQWRLNSDVV